MMIKGNVENRLEFGHLEKCDHVVGKDVLFKMLNVNGNLSGKTRRPN
jgi:hypothetical protein